MSNGIYLLLGSNVGSKGGNLVKALDLLSNFSTIVRVSSVYTSQAWGKTDQPDFLNQVVEIETGLSPVELLNQILKAEEEMGRQRTEKWGERLIDIDILFFYDLVIETTNLTIPHPHIQNRRFTLVPLHELAPNFIHPVLKKSISALLDECADTLQVKVEGA